jgi:3-hydroxybutyryl-CoA dehydrogenase
MAGTMTTVGVVGLGTMGLGIAQVFAAAGLSVLVTDAVAAARDSARERLAGALDRRVRAGRMTAEERDAILGRLVVVDGPGSMGAAELVVEAVVEDLAVKRALLAELERVVAPEVVLATNTSSLSVGALAAGLRHPDAWSASTSSTPRPRNGSWSW